MDLNCKPKDLARIISSPMTDLHGFTDKVIKVTELTTMDDGDVPGWLFEGPPLVSTFLPVVVIAGVADSLLRPIRDPGDDAVDQMVKRVGKAPRHRVPTVRGPQPLEHVE